MKVALSTVTKGGIDAETAQWRELALLSMFPNIESHWVISRSPLQDARCEQVDKFLASECTHLFILDSDTRPLPFTIQRLLLHNKLFIAAPHTSIKDHEIGTMILDRNPSGEDSYVQHHPWERGCGLQGPNVVVGCSGMLIHRSVFERIGKPWFQCRYNSEGRLTKTEDFDLCDRAFALNIEVWADCDLTQGHNLSLVI